MKNHLVENEEAIKISAKTDDCVQRFGKDGK
jgi:hypothetical protein